VAFLASQFSQGYVTAVGKISMIRYAVHLHPGNLPVFADVVHQFFLFFAVGHCFFVAFDTDVDIGNGGLLMGEDPFVAVQTAKVGLLNVQFVIVSDWLIVGFGSRTAYCQDYKQKKGEKQRTALHLPAQRFFDFRVLYIYSTPIVK
jgi:hypothetical protein